jgi:hypothetical protein
MESVGIGVHTLHMHTAKIKATIDINKNDGYEAN